MPFTLSHAVVALPFRRTVLIPSAIATGAMVPDLPLFFPIFSVREAYWVTHSWWGIVTFDLVFAAFFFAAWRVLLRPAISALSPDWARSRFPYHWDRAQSAPAERRIVAGLVLGISIVIGSVSHVVWDLFTHPARAGVEWFPFLVRMWGPLAGYDWAQYVGSTVGLVILALWAGLSFRARPLSPRVSRMPRWLAFSAWTVALVLPFVVAALDAWRNGAPASISGLVFRVGVPTMALEFALIVAVAIVFFILDFQNNIRARIPARSPAE
ncbi:MAG: DUF4184 family protein [Terrimesophilobacter sp.]